MKRYGHEPDDVQDALDIIAEIIVSGAVGVALFAFFGYLVFFA